jgi:hypothetical protein
MISELESDPKQALKSVHSAVVIFYTTYNQNFNASEDFESKLLNNFQDQVSFYRLDAINLEEIADSYQIEHYPTYIFFKKGKPLYSHLVEPVEYGEAKNWVEIQMERARRLR